MMSYDSYLLEKNVTLSRLRVRALPSFYLIMNYKCSISSSLNYPDLSHINLATMNQFSSFAYSYLI